MPTGGYNFQSWMLAEVNALQNAVAQVSARLPSSPTTAVISGSGEFLARRLVCEAKTISLAEKLGPTVSSAACAYAVAMLAREFVDR